MPLEKAPIGFFARGIEQCPLIPDKCPFRGVFTFGAVVRNITDEQFVSYTNECPLLERAGIATFYSEAVYGVSGFLEHRVPIETLCRLKVKDYEFLCGIIEIIKYNNFRIVIKCAQLDKFNRMCLLENKDQSALLLFNKNTYFLKEKTVMGMLKKGVLIFGNRIKDEVFETFLSNSEPYHTLGIIWNNNDDPSEEVKTLIGIYNNTKSSLDLLKLVEILYDSLSQHDDKSTRIILISILLSLIWPEGKAEQQALVEKYDRLPYLFIEEKETIKIAKLTPQRIQSEERYRLCQQFLLMSTYTQKETAIAPKENTLRPVIKPNRWDEENGAMLHNVSAGFSFIPLKKEQGFLLIQSSLPTAIPNDIQFREDNLFEDRGIGIFSPAALDCLIISGFFDLPISIETLQALETKVKWHCVMYLKCYFNKDLKSCARFSLENII